MRSGSDYGLSMPERGRVQTPPVRLAAVLAYHADDEIARVAMTHAQVQNTTDVERISAIMCELPDWAEGLPLAAEGGFMRRYRK